MDSLGTSLILALTSSFYYNSPFDEFFLGLALICFHLNYMILETHIASFSSNMKETLKMILKN